jgi:hypothetical protein
MSYHIIAHMYRHAYRSNVQISVFLTNPVIVCTLVLLMKILEENENTDEYKRIQKEKNIN